MHVDFRQNNTRWNPFNNTRPNPGANLTMRTQTWCPPSAFQPSVVVASAGIFSICPLMRSTVLA